MSESKLLQDFISSGEFDKAFEQFKSSTSPKKEWEIVAFDWGGKIFKLVENWRDKYSAPNFECEDCGEKGFWIHWALGPHAKGISIHSVRRLSDVSEWQVKETVEIWETGRFTIEAFEIVAGQMLIKTDGGTYLLNALQKLPQPILVTHDGVEIYNLENFRPTVLFDDYSMNTNCSEELWRNGVSRYQGKVFSTKEAAELYLLRQVENKPLLSLNDVKYILDSVQFNFPTTRDFITNALAEAVKQKLNQ